MTMRDDELVAAALAGETDAFAELVTRNRRRVEAVAERLVGEEAEDLVQESVLRAYLSLSRLRDPQRFGAWLCGIAVNLAKMRLRRRTLEKSRFAGPYVQDGLEEKLSLQAVREAVEVLPAGQREVVLMRYVDDLSCDEIATLLGLTPGAVRVRLHRAREQLRGELAGLAPGSRSKEEIRMIEMKLDDVIVRVSEDDPLKLVADRRIVLLKEVDGDRLLPIWVGPPEGNALALHLTQETTPRPMTSDLMAEIIRVMGARIERVAVTALREKTFYGVIVLAVDGRVEEVDARPSDALNLAVRAGAPIFVADDVLDESWVPPGDVDARLDEDCSNMGWEVPPGEWRSLSAELLRPFYRVP